MKRRPLQLTSIVAAVCMTPAVLAIPGTSPGELAARFQQHVDILAADEMEGRGVGSMGIKKAAEYIAAAYRSCGLKAAGDNGTYLQGFEMSVRRKLTDATSLHIAGLPDELGRGTDFVPLSFSSNEPFKGPIVFCGYGIDAPDRDRHDFVHLDLTGQVALMLRGEPASWADDKGNATRHAMFRNKMYNAKDRGASAVLIVNQQPAEGEADELVEFEERGSDDFGIPAMHVSRAVVAMVLKAGQADDLDSLQRRLDDGGFASMELKSVRVEGRAGIERETTTTHNVVGMLRGEGKNADEYVVIGAHYDHLGIQKPMMRRFKGGQLVREETKPEIHNGADDNASGVAGLLELARAFAGGPQPKRSIVFVAFSGEESGLHGSKHFVDNLPVPVESIVAMLNMDMIGRLDSASNELTVFGARTADEFLPVLKSAGEHYNIAIAPSDDPGGRSDHAPFVRKQIPSMHFFSGHHGDYHKASDDADKINADGGARVTSVVYAVTAKIADAAMRPTFQEVTVKGAATTGGPTTFRVVMGLAPSYTDDGTPGMGVDAVTAEGPAEVAGMKAGDRIIKIGKKEVANIYDYMAATRNNKPGDQVKVVVVRDGNEMTLTVTLAAAR